MKTIMCPSCGNNNVVVDESRDFAFCSYCGSQIQLKEIVKVEHSGEVSVEGLATVNSFVKKGLIEIGAGQLGDAKTSFDKAMQIAPENIFVTIGMMLVSDNKYYYSKIKKHSDTISSEEVSVIDDETCYAFAKAYCQYDDLDRITYIADKYPNAITLDLLTEKTCQNKNIDMCLFFLKYGFSVEKVFDRFFRIAYSRPYTTIIFSTVIFPLSTLEKLLMNGFNPQTHHVTFKRYYSEDPTETVTMTVTDFFRNKSNYFYSISDFRYYDSDTLAKHKSSSGPYAQLCQKYYGTDTSSERKGCYVATCCYGSYDCPQVWTLRRFRDSVLSTTWYGRAFIKAYYAISPTLVRWFGSTQLFKNFCRHRLDKMVDKLNRNGMSDSPYID